MPDETGAPAPPPLPPPPPPPLPAGSNRSVMLVLLVGYLILTVGLFLVSLVVGFLGMLQVPLWIGYVVLIVLGITNALNGKRFLIPGVSELADRI